MAYELGDIESGPVMCEGCNQGRDEVTCLGHLSDGTAIWRCAKCAGEINLQMAKGVDIPVVEAVQLSRKQANRPTKQAKEDTMPVEKTHLGMTKGVTSEATFVLDKADVAGGIRTKGERAQGIVFGSLYIPAEIAGESTKFKVTIEAVN